MATACASCEQPLVVEIDADTEFDNNAPGPSASSPATVPDDLQTPCGCHFHWECLFEACETTQCPNCATELISNTSAGTQILCNLRNEGGEQSDLDILPRLQEEHYLSAHPEERKCQAFLELCQEGDVQAIADLLSVEESGDDAEPQKPMAEFLRYQNPLGGMESGLHAAVAGGSREVAWMLLLLASNLPEQEFPALVYQEAAGLGIMRDEQTGLEDIRMLRDSQGRTAGELAAQGGPVWHGWEQRLNVAS